MGRPRQLGDTHGLTLLVGVLSLAVVLGLRRVAPAVPASLVAVALGVAAVELFGLDDHGVDIVGHIDSGLPSLGVPDASLEDFGALAAGGIGVMLVGFAEGLGAAKTYAQRETSAASCSGSAERTSRLGCRAGWSSTAACRRRR